MPHAYTEDQLVEQPAINLFAELDWATVSAMEEVLGSDGTLQRETTSDVVLAPRLRVALATLNPNLPTEALDSAMADITRDRGAMTRAAANREVWNLIRGGVKVSIPDHEHGGQLDETVRVVDWDTPNANDFVLVSQMTITGQLYTCRPDLIGFVNGLPLVVIELKKPGVPARNAFDDNLTSYMHPQNGVLQLFWYNALLIASNGTESRVGSITADWERFFEWKRVEREDEPRRVSLAVMLRGTCEKARLLDIVENFTLFSESKEGLVKIIAQNHQYLGVNNAIVAMLDAREAGHGRGGVFWQTQGSGKSLAMVFFSQKVLRKVPGDWSFVIVTDSVELDEQIARTFAACGAVSDPDASHASSGDNLKELLSGNNRYVFTLIQKFQAPDVLSDRRDVVVLTDEAHRSQYDTLALNMRGALPRAMFVAFTGTPLIVGEERTRDLFGDYVSVYDFQQSVEDGATVPLYYENRTPELHLDNANLNDDLYDLIEEAELDDSQERRLERELGRQYHLITRDDRLDVVAQDIVRHFLGRGFLGKAMVVSIDKATAIRMYDKVRARWDVERERVEAELARLRRYGNKASPDNGRGELQRRLEVLDTTDMAVIVSPEQNEIARMSDMGLNIVPHRQRMVSEELDEKFKDAADPLRIAFVCAMWLTGFDAPSCSTIYLDKPMRNHTLMQTIARANRVYRDKHSGLIVDYANVFTSLEKALAIYGTGAGDATPVRDKTELDTTLRDAMTDTLSFCKAHSGDIDRIEALPAGSLERLSAVADSVEQLISPDGVRKEFLASERWVATLFTAVKPAPAALEFAGRATALTTIANVIRERTGAGATADIGSIMGAINRLLDESIAADGFRIPEANRNNGHAGVIDLSAIDFEKLAKRFAKSSRKNVELEQLKAAIRAQLERMIGVNKTRLDYLGRFEALIEAYNSGSRNIEQLFQELLTFSQGLSEEEGRHVREQLSEEELTVFDLLTRPGPDLSPEERREVKKVARTLLQKVKGAVALDWRRRSQARAQIRLAIEDALDAGLPKVYDPVLYRHKVASLFEHVYERYPGGISRSEMSGGAQAGLT